MRTLYNLQKYCKQDLDDCRRLKLIQYESENRYKTDDKRLQGRQSSGNTCKCNASRMKISDNYIVGCLKACT